MDSPRNFMIEDVEINYPRLDPNRPQENPFAKGQFYWEMQISTTDPEKAKLLRDNHVNVKERDGKFVASLKRKTKKANGDDNGPVRVVGSDLTPLADVNKIGNGSRGNVILFQYPWENFGNSGVGSSLTAVQVTDLQVYEASSSVDFTAVAGGTSSTAEAAEESLPAPF